MILTNSKNTDISASYYQEKYQLSAVHRDAIALTEHIQSNRIQPIKLLDLGCGRGRNALFFQQQGFQVTACDQNPKAIDYLNHIISEEALNNISTHIYDINQANLNETYDVIYCGVVMMFLQACCIPKILSNMQEQTKRGGYNTIICAMSTSEYPCNTALSFTFKENELSDYYADWNIISYNENLGQLHRRDENGDYIKLQFATITAQKP